MLFWITSRYFARLGNTIGNSKFNSNLFKLSKLYHDRIIIFLSACFHRVHVSRTPPKFCTTLWFYHPNSLHHWQTIRVTDGRAISLDYNFDLLSPHKDAGVIIRWSGDHETCLIATFNSFVIMFGRLDLRESLIILEYRVLASTIARIIIKQYLYTSFIWSV